MGVCLRARNYHLKRNRLPDVGLRPVEKPPNALTLRDSGRTLLRRRLCPIRDLAKPDLVFRGIPVDGDREFGHRTRTYGADIILPELCHGGGNSLI